MAGSGAARHDCMAFYQRSHAGAYHTAAVSANASRGAFTLCHCGKLYCDLRRVRASLEAPSAPGTRRVRRGASRIGGDVSFGAPVYWGILHLLGACMLLYAAVRKRWEALPGTYACGAALLVFVLTFALPIRVRVGAPFLFPLGLRTAAFASADYYPLLPWGALFFAAAAAAERLDEMPPEKKYRSAPRALVWLSRRSLFIYLIHQPVLFALAALLQHAAQGT